VSSDGLGR